MVTRQKVRIILKSFEHKVLDSSTEQIVETAERTGRVLPARCRCPRIFAGSASSVVRTWTRTPESTSKSGPTSGS